MQTQRPGGLASASSVPASWCLLYAMALCGAPWSTWAMMATLRMSARSALPSAGAAVGAAAVARRWRAFQEVAIARHLSARQACCIPLAAGHRCDARHTLPINTERALTFQHGSGGGSDSRLATHRLCHHLTRCMHREHRAEPLCGAQRRARRLIFGPAYAAARPLGNAPQASRTSAQLHIPEPLACVWRGTTAGARPPLRWRTGPALPWRDRAET